MGSPSMNLAEARLVRNGGPGVMFADYKIPVPEQAIAEHPGLERFWDRKVIVGLRPSSLEDAAFAPSGWPHLTAEAGVTEQLGSEVDVIFPVRTPPVEHEVMTVQFDKAATGKDPTGEHHDQTSGLVGADASLWTAKVNAKTSARRGRAIDLAVDTSALYWFDPDSGLAIARQAGGDRPSTIQDATPHKPSPDGDYECPYSRMAFRTIQRLEQQFAGQLRFVFRQPQPVAGCEECLKTGSWWVHLRMCQTCGRIGCCDSSPNRHASRHAHHDHHPIARSVEPGEDWSWCYLDQIGFVLDTATENQEARL
jgi:Zn-finger in ubiquitin-hydrolases and other protein/MalK OB fold domain